jgi:hypothetical protein
VRAGRRCAAAREVLPCSWRSVSSHGGSVRRPDVM